MSIPSSLTPLFSTGAGGAAGYQIERSLRFNSADSAYLSRTPASTSTTTTWTWSAWVKRSTLGAKGLFGAYYGSASRYFLLRFSSSDQIDIFGGDYSTSSTTTNVNLITTSVYRDLSAWMHIVFTYDTTNGTSSDRACLYVNGVRVTDFSTATYPGPSSATFVNYNTATHYIGAWWTGSEFFDGYLADIHHIDGQALTPSSFTEVSATTGQLVPIAYTGTFGTNGFKLKFSDNSAATAATLGADTSGNGNNWTPNNLSVGPSSNTFVSNIAAFNTTWTNISNAFDGSTSTYADGTGNTGTLSTIVFSTPLTGVTLLEYFYDGTSTYGYNSTDVGTGPNLTGGSYVTVYSGTAITVNNVRCTAQAGNGVVRLYAIRVNGTVLTGYTEFNPASIDSLVDTPTSNGTDTGAGGEVRGNYATWNPLQSSAATLTNGNLDCTTATATGGQVRATIAVSSGKWYWEVTVNTTVTANNIGIVKTSQALAADDPSYLAGGYSYYGSTGDKRNNASASAYGATYGSGDVIGVALDLDAGTLVFYKNGASQGTAFSSLTGEFIPCVGDGTGSNGLDMTTNFGQRAFAHPVSGFKALCDTNLGAPLVAKPNTLMDVVLYTGNGSTQTISGLAFSPDLIWTKSRSQAYSHNLYDSVRGIHKNLFPNETSAENTDTNTIQAFNSDGFQIGSNDNGNYTNGGSAVAWTWDAGTSTDPSNTAGSITSQVRANVSAGFSVVTYTGTGANATVGHGLGVAPGFIIIKNRSSATNWRVYHSALGNTKVIFLSTTGGSDTNSVYWNNTSPTSTVFSVGSDDGANGNTNLMVAYCFAPVVGYSSFGSYVGNGSADGPMVYTGMRPRWLLVKSSSYADEWRIYDAVRLGYNAVATILTPNDSQAEGTSGYPIDLLSNGFKLRGAGGPINTSSATYIYYAVAENPFQYARAR